MTRLKGQPYWTGAVGQQLDTLNYGEDDHWGRAVAQELALKLQSGAAISLTHSAEDAGPLSWPVPDLHGLNSTEKTAVDQQLGQGVGQNKKIVLLGPESSGKSTLALQLAEQMGWPQLSEYVRRWIDWGAGVGSWQEMASIAQVQWAAEQALGKIVSGPVLLDTALPGVAQWSQTLYGQLPIGLSDPLEHWQADWVFLLAPDLPWQPDPQRCQPELAERWAFFHALEAYLKRRAQPYGVISGAERLQQACQQLAVHFASGR